VDGENQRWWVGSVRRADALSMRRKTSPTSLRTIRNTGNAFPGVQHGTNFNARKESDFGRSVRATGHRSWI